MTTTSSSGDWLDDALLTQAREHQGDYIADDGFTARVMATLPAPAPVVPRWRRPAEIALWIAAGAGAAVAAPGLAIDVGREAFRLLAAQPLSLPQVAVSLVAFGAVTWTAAAWALRSD